MKKVLLTLIAIGALTSCKKKYGEIGRPKNGSEQKAEQVYNAWCAAQGNCNDNEKLVHVINTSDAPHCEKISTKMIYENRRDDNFAMRTHTNLKQSTRDSADIFWHKYADIVISMEKQDSIAKKNGNYQFPSSYDQFYGYSAKIDYDFWQNGEKHSDYFYAIVDPDMNYIGPSKQYVSSRYLEYFEKFVPYLGEGKEFYKNKD